MMHGPINVKPPNNISKWQMGFNSAFKELNVIVNTHFCEKYSFILNSKFIFESKSGALGREREVQ
jgi:hypothetical protein